jgi:two-component system chemotaxis sensor kinase CheA
MAIDLGDEILQDFLVEAGEILELLGKQLVELEQSPNDLGLLNAIFRGFHTVKGGAGFLAINPLVAVCHTAEDVFNVLRQGERQVTPDLMDVILRVVDVVNEMFDQVRQGRVPESAEQELLDRLQQYAGPGEVAAVEEVAVVEPEALVDVSETVQVEPVPVVEPDVVEQTFDAMVAEQQPSVAPNASESDDITEEEFEQLLDKLHGKGGSPTQKKTESAPVNEAVPEKPKKVAAPKPKDKPAAAEVKTEAAAALSENISEAEFEQLLDELHGKGKFDPTVVKNFEPVEADKPAVVETVAKADAAKPTPEQPAVEKAKPEATEKPAPAKDKPEPKAAEANSQEKIASEKPSRPEAPKPERPAPSAAKEKVSPRGGRADVDNGKPAPSASVAQADTTVRVEMQVLDDIMNMVGELVLVRNRFQTLKANSEAGEELSKAISNLDVVTADLQLAVMKTRMQPIKKVFGRFPRVVRDLARSLKKEIRLELVGEDTDLDKNLVEALADPLVHLVRNAVDHGIETPDEREAKGKPREGVVILKASQEGDHIELSIRDDGKGMNPDALRAKVVEKGLMDEETAARLDDKECFNLIFMPGFSTKTEISDVSGRGVGMDVVKTRISQMNGVVEVNSLEGYGSTILIKVPLTLAILPTLIIKLAGYPFALPLASVLEILDLDLTKNKKVDGQLVAMVRNRALPLFYLREWLIKDVAFTPSERTTGHVVVVNAGGRNVGFVVDQLIGQEEVVIKALGAKLHGLDGLAGATITGDGRIALILDVMGLVKKYAN